MARGGSWPAVYGPALNNLGMVQEADGDWGAAAESYSAALDAARQSDNRALAATSGLNRARALFHNGEPQPARNFLMELSAAALTRSDEPRLAESQVALGRLAQEFDQGAKDQFGLPKLEQDLFGHALENAERRHDWRTASLAAGYLAQTEARLGHKEKADLLLTRAFRHAEHDGAAPDLLFRWDWQLGRSLAARGDRGGAMAAYRRAIEEVEASRADIAVEYRAGKSTFVENYGALYLEFADLLLQHAHETRQPSSLLIEARATLETMKAAELRDYFQDPCLEGAAAHRKSIDDFSAHTAVLYPILLPDRLELLVFYNDGPQEFVVPVASGEFAETARSFKSLIRKRTTREYLDPAKRLYGWMIAPILGGLESHGVDTIVWVPDATLRGVPLAALYDGESYLIDRFAVATTPGLTLIDPRRAAPKRNVEALLAGISQSVQGFPALPNVGAEIDQVHELTGGTVLLDETFQTKAFALDLEQRPFSVIHIASHGHFDHDPNNSYLLAFDGKLTLDALERAIKGGEHFDSPLELLVLSACQTAEGDDQAALGLAGVALKAGARSAVASLWFVSDQAAGPLVTRFYAELNGSASKAQALRQAQIALKQDLRFRHPAFWSPFLLVGNWL
jgi:CHAT domain-containing protein